MQRARRRGTRLVIPALRLAFPALLGLAACAKSKPNETPAPKPETEAGAGVAPASAGKVLLCTDGAHRRGDHWKVDCNVCRCGADGAVLCSEFPCADRGGPRDASHTD